MGYTYEELKSLGSEAITPDHTTGYSYEQLKRLDTWGEGGRVIEDTVKHNSSLFKKTAGSFAKGFASDLAAIPDEIGVLFRETGEKGGAGYAIPSFNDGVALAAKWKGKRPPQTAFDKKLEKLGKTISDMNRNWVESIGLEPEEGSELSKHFFNLGAGTSSVASSLGLMYATRMPTLLFGLFGARQKAQIYDEFREAGKSEVESSAFSSVAGLVEGGVEAIGGVAFLKSISFGNGIARTLVRMGEQGMEEALQQSGEEILTHITGVRKDGIREAGGRIAYSAALGMVLGFPAGAITTRLEKSGIIKELQNYGMSEKSAKKAIKKISEKTFESGEVAQVILDHVESEMRETEAIHNERFQIEQEPVEEPPIKEDEPVGEESIEPVKEENKKSPDQIEKLEAKLEKIKDKKERADLAKQGKEDLRHILDIVQKRVKIPKKGEAEFEEGQEVPTRFRNQKGVSLDEIRDELSGVGIIHESTSETVRYLDKLDRQLKNLDAIISENKEANVTKKEGTTLRQRIKDIKSGIRQGKVETAQEVKAAQKELVKIINESEIEPEQKKGFLKTIPTIQNRVQLSRALPKIEARLDVLEESAAKDRTQEAIKKELKFTKPVKKGSRKVAKYDYETNKFIGEIRGLAKLTKKAALTELLAMPKEGLSPKDLMKARLLSYKANGKSSSLALTRQVLADIKKLKALGEAAKNEIEFEAALRQEEDVRDALGSLEKSEASKESLPTMVGNIYRQGFANYYSLLNSMFGKNFADRWDQELNESNKYSDIFHATKDVSSEASDIYGRDIEDVFTELQEAKYNISEVKQFEAHRNLTHEITKWELIDIYNSIKNPLIKERFDNTYGKEQIERLMNELSPTDIALADLLQEAVQSYRNVMNERYIEMTGRDLGTVENYWPSSSEFVTDPYGDRMMQGETASAQKERAKSKFVTPKPKNAWYKYQKHISEGEHIKHLSRPYEQMHRMFSERSVEHAIREKFGDKVYGSLMDHLEKLSLHKEIERIDYVSGIFKHAINNWVTAKIALNPSTFIRQLMSVGNYMEDMPAADWTKLFFEGISDPRKTFDYMWQNNPFLEARFNKGYSEALADAIEGASKLNKHWGNWQNFLSSFARTGDIAAIVFGGYPVMKTKGTDSFHRATLKAQQASISISLSNFQANRSPFARVFLAFKNTSSQYMRKMVDAIIMRQNEDISGEQFAKVMTIYGVIQPTLYVLSGIAVTQAFKAIGGNADDPEETAKEALDQILIQLVVNPVNAIPFLADGIEYAMREFMGKNNYKFLSLPMFDDMEDAARKISAGDYFEAIGNILEPVTAAPVNLVQRYSKLIFDAGTKRPVRRKTKRRKTNRRKK